MSNFRDEDYAYILGDCLHDIFYVDSSYRGKIAQMRLLSEIKERKLIDYNKIYEHLLDLISCLFIQFFSKHTFGTNQKIVSCFSLLPPIIRYKVLSFLYANDNHNIILIDKLVLVTLKEFGKEKTTQWLEDNKAHLTSIPTDFYDNMYQYSLRTVATNMKATYQTMEEAKVFFNHNKKAFVEDTEEEVRDFAKLMEFFYTGRKLDTKIVPSEYVVSFHDKK